MKKINNYSAQYKIISRSFATANAQNFTEQLHNQNQNHAKNTTKLHKKTLSKEEI